MFSIRVKQFKSEDSLASLPAHAGRTHHGPRWAALLFLFCKGVEIALYFAFGAKL
jgi:hypothetical protein